MPFTFAHPSIILPFKSKAFNLSGLIFGSMAPDIIYFVLFSPSSNLGHTFWGSVLFNLPMCFVLNYLFYKYIQELFICTLPGFISVKYMYMIKNKNVISNKTDVFRFSYSCVFGMGTHILWDAFTHKTGFFVQKISFLNNSVFLFHRNIPIYKILQHGSSVIGFLIIFIFLNISKDTVNKTYSVRINKRKARLSIVLITVISTVLFLIFFFKIKGFVGVGRIIITFINSVFLSYLIIGFLYYNITHDQLS